MFTPVDQDWLTVTVRDLLTVLENDQWAKNAIMADAQAHAAIPWGHQAFPDTIKEFVTELMDRALTTMPEPDSNGTRVGASLIRELVSNYPHTVWDAIAQHFWNQVEIEES